VTLEQSRHQGLKTRGLTSWAIAHFVLKTQGHETEMDQEPQDQRDERDHEGELFSGSSERAQQLYRESKRVRRLTERKLWWQANGAKPREPEKEG